MIPFQGVVPQVGRGVFIADTARVIGDVELGDEVSVWFGCVLRGDVGSIRVGARSNVQDLSMLHMSRDLSNTVIGEEVTIGHRVIVHGATIGDGALIGMGAILLDNCSIGAECIIGAGALVTQNTVVPPRTLFLGSPGKVIRELKEAEWRQGRELALRYVENARAYQPG